jgi:hypothetical protein
MYIYLFRYLFSLTNFQRKAKNKLYPLYAMEAQGGRGGIAPTHT